MEEEEIKIPEEQQQESKYLLPIIHERKDETLLHLYYKEEHKIATFFPDGCYRFDHKLPSPFFESSFPHHSSHLHAPKKKSKKKHPHHTMSKNASELHDKMQKMLAKTWKSLRNQ